MSKAILRFKKFKSLSTVASCLQHNLRDGMNAAPHADPTRRDTNVVLVGPQTAAEATAETKRKLASVRKIRSNAVLAFEVVLGASPEFFNRERPYYSTEVAAWKDGSCSWLSTTFGASNIVSVVLHADETSPHVQALVVPIESDRLRAIHWLGSPEKLRILQTSYAKAVAPANLHRGEEGSWATYQKVSSFYTLANGFERALSTARRMDKLPSLPFRDSAGRVADRDWLAHGRDLERFNAQFCELRDGSLAVGLMQSSALGKEMERRAANAKRRQQADSAALMELQELLRRNEDLLAEQLKRHTVFNDEAAARAGEITVLDAQIKERRDVLKLDLLEAYREELRAEVDELQRERER